MVCETALSKEDLFELMSNAVKGDEEDVAFQEIEFWSFCCDKEIELREFDSGDSGNIVPHSRFVAKALTYWDMPRIGCKDYWGCHLLVQSSHLQRARWSNDCLKAIIIMIQMLLSGSVAQVITFSRGMKNKNSSSIAWSMGNPSMFSGI
ncbi:unnamed protein product [Prunus armeniaca]